VNLCVGSSHNFGVPLTVGSIYNWKLENTSIATIVSGNGTELITIDLNNTGVSQLIVEEIDVNGCIGYDSVLIEVHALPNPIITASAVNFCEGDSVLLQTDSFYNEFLWSNNEISSYIYADVTANYSVSVTDMNGCSNTSNPIFINSYSSPIADFIFNGVCLKNPTIFINQSIISSGQIISAIWDLGNGYILTGDSISHIYNAIGDYEILLSIENDIGCTSSLTKTISIFESPEANFTYNPSSISTLSPEISFINTSVNAVPLLWKFGDEMFSSELNPSHIYDDPGIYDVMLIVEDMNECTDSISKQIMMYYDFVLYVPTAFTPNNDGDNDTFGPNGLRMEKYKSYDFQIYNKWGEIIFETTDINEWWDGADSPSEVYSWILIITDELGEVRKENGLVTLIR